MLNIAFFTEAGTKKGMGHLVRCYTIATKFKQNNHNIDFFLYSDVDYSYKYDDIIQFSWTTLHVAKQYDIVFIDSYIASLDIYDMLNKQTSLLVCIDDYNRLKYPKKSVIINFAPDSKKYFQVSTNHTYLLGTKYLPIREEFSKATTNSKKHIFIMLGGSDIKNLTADIVNTLETIQLPKVVVINNENKKNQLKKYKDTKILYKPDDKTLIENISQSICAITTASMSVYELASLNIPSIIIAISKDQEIGIDQMIKYNIAKYKLNIQNKNYKTSLLEYIKKIIQEKNYNTDIDTNGTQRIYDNIIGLIK